MGWPCFSAALRNPGTAPGVVLGTWCTLHRRPGDTSRVAARQRPSTVTAVRDLRHTDRPTLVERAVVTPPPTPLEAARLDEALHAGHGIDIARRAYGIGSWGRLTIRRLDG